MEFFTIFLSSLLTVLSPIGLVIDTVVANRIRSQVKGVEQLAVRIDNTPSYQPIQGKIDRIRIASRGLKPVEDFRIELFELETDGIDININRLQETGFSGLKDIRQSLRKPLQGGLHLIVKESDINQALASEITKERIQNIVNRFLRDQAPEFNILALRLEFKPENRIAIEVKIQQVQGIEENQPPEIIELSLETGLKTDDGRILQLLDLGGTLDGRTLSKKFLSRFQEFDLAILEKQGIITRILKLKVDEEQFDLVTFLRLDPLTLEAQSREP